MQRWVHSCWRTCRAGCADRGAGSLDGGALSIRRIPPAHARAELAACSGMPRMPRGRARCHPGIQCHLLTQTTPGRCKASNCEAGQHQRVAGRFWNQLTD